MPVLQGIEEKLVSIPAVQGDGGGQGNCWAWPRCCFSIPAAGFTEGLPAELLLYFPSFSATLWMQVK